MRIMEFFKFSEIQKSVSSVIQTIGRIMKDYGVF